MRKDRINANVFGRSDQAFRDSFDNTLAALAAARPAARKPKRAYWKTAVAAALALCLTVSGVAYAVVRNYITRAEMGSGSYLVVIPPEEAVTPTKEEAQAQHEKDKEIANSEANQKWIAATTKDFGQACQFFGREIRLPDPKYTEGRLCPPEFGTPSDFWVWIEYWREDRQVKESFMVRRHETEEELAKREAEGLPPYEFRVSGVAVQYDIAGTTVTKVSDTYEQEGETYDSHTYMWDYDGLTYILTSGHFCPDEEFDELIFGMVDPDHEPLWVPSETPPEGYVNVRGVSYSIENTSMLHLRQVRLTDADLEALGQLTNLTYLHLGYSLDYSGVTDLSFLRGLTKLQDLNLSYNFDLRDIRPLADLTGLEQLNLYLNKISDTGPLMGLNNLKKLSLGVNCIDSEQFAALQAALPGCDVTGADDQWG